MVDSKDTGLTKAIFERHQAPFVLETAMMFLSTSLMTLFKRNQIFMVSMKKEIKFLTKISKNILTLITKEKSMIFLEAQ